MKLFLVFIITSLMLQSDFLSEQKRYERVRNALSNKGNHVNQTLSKNALNANDLNILMVAYKAEKELHIYAKKTTDVQYKKIESYEICSSSGELGPKRKQGDYQVPEGFYHIDRFNPVSSFHLSLGVNYPNSSDRKKSSASNLGGDIFIHGACVTIGCLPMTDEKIEEIYLYAVHAKNSGQTKIPVYIFPFKMTAQNFEKYKTEYTENIGLINFWSNIKQGYDLFESNKKALKINTDDGGNYLLSN